MTGKRKPAPRKPRLDPSQPYARDNGRVGGGARDVVRAADLAAADLEEAENQTQDRVESAIKLRMGGAPYSEIAEFLGYPSAFAARAAVERGLAAGNDPQAREHERKLHARRLDRLLKAVWTKAINPRDPDQLHYHRAALAVVDRQSRLLGLDAPTQVALYTPTQQEIEKVVAEFQVLVASEDQAQEADILEAQFDDDTQA